MTAAQVIPEKDRRTYMGSHDTAAVSGFHPWLNPAQVFMNKTGMSKGQADNDQLYFGRLLEPVILSEFAERMHVTLSSPGFVRHPTLEWFGGTPDGMLDGRRAGVDAKNIRYLDPQKWGDDGSGDVPEYIAFQAQHFMALFDYPVWYIAALFAGCEFRIYPIERDREMSDLIVEMDGAFWNEHVVPKIPPPIDGSDSCRRMLERLHPKEKAAVRAATAEETDMLLILRGLEKQEESCKDEAERMRNLLRDSIGDAAGITCDFAKVSYKLAKGRAGIDTKALKAEMPAIAAKFEKTGDPTRALRVTFTKEKKS